MRWMGGGTLAPPRKRGVASARDRFHRHRAVNIGEANRACVKTCGAVSGVTTGAASQLAGNCATTGNSPEVVFTWTPSTSGTAQLSTCGAGVTSYDTVMYVRSGVCGAEFACNDDTPGCGTASNTYHGSRISLAVTAGQTYTIVVDGYNGRNGSFQLLVVPPS